MTRNTRMKNQSSLPQKGKNDQWEARACRGICNKGQLWYRPRFRNLGPHRHSARPLSLSRTLEMLDCRHSIFNRFQNLGSTPQLPFHSWQAADMAGPITCQDGPQGPKTQIPAEGKAVCFRQSDMPINEMHPDLNDQ